MNKQVKRSKINSFDEIFHFFALDVIFPYLNPTQGLPMYTYSHSGFVGEIGATLASSS